MLEAAGTTFGYTLHFHPLQEEEILVDDEKYSVETFKVFHRIDCWGFIFREKKKPRRINKDIIGKYRFSANTFERLKMGENVTTEAGETVMNETVTTANTPSLSYAFCGDTVYNILVAEKVKGVTMLYHETTYLKELEERALARYHSTTVQAADIAIKAAAGRLLIGHFSSKYEELHEFLEQTREVFPQTDLAIEGVTYRVMPF